MLQNKIRFLCTTIQMCIFCIPFWTTPAAAYTQEGLFQEVVLPLFKSYPEIAWFADDSVAFTQEGVTSRTFAKSWTAFLVEAGLLKKTDKKYIELERMVHSLVCFYLLENGTSEAYRYWVQNQTTAVLKEESFQDLHRVFKKFIDTSERRKAVEASLVYSDLGKTPEAKKRAHQLGIVREDHDDFMEAVYSASSEVRNKIIPSFDQFNSVIQHHILELHLAVPLHWGHAIHLEGGEGLFSRLKSSQALPSFINQAYLIQVCDVAAAQAHIQPNGFIAFNQSTYLGYRQVLEAIENLLKTKNPETTLFHLTLQKAEQLGLAEDSENWSILARIGAFLRLSTKEEGTLLKKTAVLHWKKEDWQMVQDIFGLKSGLNQWKRNPTYLPAVLLNLFQSTPVISEQYERALNGVLVLAKIGKEYQTQGSHLTLDSPLCFNSLAAQAKAHPEWFNPQPFHFLQIDWTHPGRVEIAIHPKKPI